MLEVSEAREKLLAQFSPGKTEHVPFYESTGRVLAESVTAEVDSPVFTNSAVDGVALKISDIGRTDQDGNVYLKLIGKIAAGDDPGLDYQTGSAVLIMTGAPLPEWADAVVKVEETDLDFNSADIPESVQIKADVEKGQNIRFRGENLTVGSEMLGAGHRLMAQDVGALAMMGKKQVEVYQKPRIGIFASGDELVEPGIPLEHGQIWNSNLYMLSSQVQGCGAETVKLGIVPDRKEAILDALEALEDKQVDLILTSGGVSMGMFDFVRTVIEENGSLDFWKVNMRPGKPLAFGRFRGIPFIGLPGNPVSSFVGASIFVCPAVQKMAGAVEKIKLTLHARLMDEVKLDSRETYLPGILSQDVTPYEVRLVGNQSSGNLYSLVQANCLIKIAPGVQSLKQESLVEIIML